MGARSARRGAAWGVMGSTRRQPGLSWEPSQSASLRVVGIPHGSPPTRIGRTENRKAQLRRHEVTFPHLESTFPTATSSLLGSSTEDGHFFEGRLSAIITALRPKICHLLVPSTMGKTSPFHT